MADQEVQDDGEQTLACRQWYEEHEIPDERSNCAAENEPGRLEKMEAEAGSAPPNRSE